MVAGRDFWVLSPLLERNVKKGSSHINKRENNNIYSRVREREGESLFDEVLLHLQDVAHFSHHPF